MARRTLRHYAAEPVDPKFIDALLDIAFAAPSKSDFQQATVIRVEDAAKRGALADLVPGTPWTARPRCSWCSAPTPAASKKFAPCVESRGRTAISRRSSTRPSMPRWCCRPSCWPQASPTRLLSDQRHPQPSRRCRAHPRAARCGAPGRGPHRRPSGHRRPCQHAVAAGRHTHHQCL